MKSIAHLGLTGWLLYHSSRIVEKKEMTKNTFSEITHCSDLLVLHVEDCDVGFDKSGVSSFSLLSRRQILREYCQLHIVTQAEETGKRTGGVVICL